MYKYLKYLAIVGFTPVRKVVGLFWYYVAVPFRAYSRNTVYNYVLQNDIWLKRLYEREVIDQGSAYFIKGTNGYIKKRSVSKAEYLFAYWVLWIWVDDDSNYDTMDLGYLINLMGGKHDKKWVVKMFGNHIKRVIWDLFVAKFGNTFDLGDRRAEEPLFDLVCSTLWLWRNTAYNAKYMQYETVNVEDVFLFTVGGKRFGWVAEHVVEGKQNYTLVFWG